MCSSPHILPNPNYGKKFKAGDPFSLKDCTSKTIAVPCGHCDECIAVKQMYLVQRVQMESLSNHVFFCTLTYNNDMLPSLTTSQGITLRYSDIADFQRMFKRLRHDNAFGRSFRYFLVTERGSEKARPHAHILFFVPKEKGDNYSDIVHLERILFDNVLKYWSRNVGSDKKPVYKPCCTYVRKFIFGKLKTNYDLHYVVPSGDDPSCCNVVFYCLKYMLKSSYHDVRLQQALRLNYDDDEYRDTWNLVKSRCVLSKGFGLGASIQNGKLSAPNEEILKYLRECISISKAQNNFDYPCYFNSISGQSFPLAPYFKKRGDIYTYSDALSFYFNKRTDTLDNSDPRDIKKTDTRDGFVKYMHDCIKHHEIAEELCDADLFDQFFD